MYKALVIGGGVAGIQTSLDLADMGFKTYVVERNPTIGGRMGQLDKTFPTLDCSMCILAPKMVDCAKHENIELISYAEVTEVDGFIGNFTVKVEKKPRYVDEALCTGCGSCQEACPIEIPNYYDEGVGMVKAAFIPFPQAVPLCALYHYVQLLIRITVSNVTYVYKHAVLTLSTTTNKLKSLN